MEPMHWEYIGALGGVIGIGWLFVVPMYRGWKPPNQKMSAQIKESTTLLAECEVPGHASSSSPSTSGATTC